MNCATFLTLSFIYFTGYKTLLNRFCKRLYIIYPIAVFMLIALCEEIRYGSLLNVVSYKRVAPKQLPGAFHEFADRTMHSCLQ